MQETLQILDNIRNIYASTYSMERLKEFERVLDELDVYVFDNWMDGEVVEGPKDSRYFTEVALMYAKDQMPDPEGGKRLLDYGCTVSFQKDVLLEPRQIKTYDDLRPGTQKGKIDQKPIWLVRIKMPKSLMKDMSDAIKVEPTTGIDDFNPNLGESIKLTEDLRQGDMEGLISPVFGIDTYKSKMGEDADIVTLNFRVNTSEAAQDLSKFFERGYAFVLDADASPANDSKDHMVFVELQRGRDTVQQIKELLYGINKLSKTEAFRFRYKDDFRSNPVSEDNIRKMVPLSTTQ